MNDPACFIARMVANNLFVNLFKGENVAPLIPKLLEQVDLLSDPEYWVMLEEVPTVELSELRLVLNDLYAVVAERARDDPGTTAVLRAAGRSGLAVVAEVARERAALRMQTVGDGVAAELLDAGFSSRATRRPSQLDEYRWPSDDFLILVDVATIFEWQQNLEELVERSRPHLSDRIGYYMAPVRDGRVVGSSAIKVLTNVFPTEDVRQWPDLPLPLLDEQLGDAVRRNIGALIEASGIIASIRGDELHDDEFAALDAALARARESLTFIDAIPADTNDSLIIEVRSALVEMSGRVKDEMNALGSGERVDQSLAASYLNGLGGQGNELFMSQIATLLSCVEWDVKPEGAWSRIERALDLT